jgi:hypothetical protein
LALPNLWGLYNLRSSSEATPAIGEQHPAAEGRFHSEDAYFNSGAQA